MKQGEGRDRDRRCSAVQNSAEQCSTVQYLQILQA
jgi:hypothetical protein